MRKSSRFKSSILAKFCYGSADIYGGGSFVIISTFYTVFLTKALGMSPFLAGTIPLIGKIWDAVTDPIMGNICDRTRSRFGPKRFYILIGSVVSALTFTLMWIGMSDSHETVRYIFYLLMYMLFSTGFTIVMVPYNGLLPDMVDDYTERSKFTGVRMMFSTFGSILAGLVPAYLIKDNTSTEPYFVVAVLFSAIFLVSILITFFGTWERQKEPVKVNLVQSFIQSFTVFKSRSFRLFIAIFLLGQGAADFVMGLAVYYVDDVLHSYGNFAFLMGVILFSQFIGTIVFTSLMAKTSKKFPILFGFSLRIAATLGLLFFSYEGVDFNIILVLSCIIGFGMSGSSTTIYAILSDMADVDELITSISRAGTVSAMATFVRKIATGFSAALIGFLLSSVGFDGGIAQEGLRQAAFTEHGIALIYVLAPVILMASAIIATLVFPMKKKEFNIIKREIARRKGQDPTKPSPEEIQVIERVTGRGYDQLWNKDNALKLFPRR